MSKWLDRFYHEVKEETTQLQCLPVKDENLTFRLTLKKNTEGKLKK